MTKKYRAYLSYSHIDSGFADKLHKALETFRVPKHLIAQGAPPSLAPIFRDRSELPTHGALEAKLKEAVANSEALIVVCSPAAAASNWVNQEVLEFKRVGDKKRILAIVAEGAPPAVFPPALRYRVDPKGTITDEEEEPIAADARLEGDGVRDAQLKVAAGLLQVGFDDLKQRELQRKHRRIAALATISTSIGLVLAVLLVLAVMARNDADRRLLQAESLISFMLGDLRRQLQPLGRLDVLDSVGDQAMAFYAALQPQDMTDEMLLSRGRALRQIGEVQTAQGRLDEGLRSFRSSLAFVQELKRRRPDRNDVVFELGQAQFWIGSTELARSNLPAAKDAFELYAANSRSVADHEPENLDYQLEVVYALSNLGTVELAADNLPVAVQYFEQAVALNESMLAAHPDQSLLKHELAEGLSWLGATADDMGRVADAVQWYGKELALREELRTLPDKNMEYAFHSTQLLLATQTYLMGNFLQAEALAQDALAGGQRLVQHDDTNTLWQRLLNRADLLAHQIQLQREQVESLEPLVATADNTRALWRLDTDNDLWLSDYARSLLTLGQARLQHNRPTQALQSIEEGLNIVASKSTVNELLSMTALEAELQLALGDAHRALNQIPQAIDAWESVIALTSTVDPMRFQPISFQARGFALARLGRHGEAREIQDELVDRGYLFVKEVARIGALE